MRILSALIFHAISVAAVPSAAPAAKMNRRDYFLDYLMSLAEQRNATVGTELQAPPSPPPQVVHLHDGMVCNDLHSYADILAYVTGICCDQGTEKLCQSPFGGTSPYPESFRNKRCALAMNESAEACLPWLSETAQNWMEPQREQTKTAMIILNSY
eukprot:COSAG02_NODE_3534_length_6598_cov_2.728112_1_plen_155_part_10